MVGQRNITTSNFCYTNSPTIASMVVLFVFVNFFWVRTYTKLADSFSQYWTGVHDFLLSSVLCSSRYQFGGHVEPSRPFCASFLEYFSLVTTRYTTSTLCRDLFHNAAVHKRALYVVHSYSIIWVTWLHPYGRCSNIGLNMSYYLCLFVGVSGSSGHWLIIKGAYCKINFSRSTPIYWSWCAVTTIGYTGYLFPDAGNYCMRRESSLFRLTGVLCIQLVQVSSLPPCVPYRGKLQGFLQGTFP